MPKINLNLKFIVEKERILYFARFLDIKIRKNIFREARANLCPIKNNWAVNKQLSEKIINDIFEDYYFPVNIKVSIFPRYFYLGASEAKKQLILFGQPLRSKNFSSAIILHEIVHIFLSKIKIKRKPIVDEIICFLAEEMIYSAENKHLEEIWAKEELDVFHRKAIETAVKYKDKLIFDGNIKKDIKYLLKFFKKELPEKITKIIPYSGLLKNIKIKNEQKDYCNKR